MGLIKLYKKIDRKMKKNPGKVLGFYNNLICGILGGVIIGFAIKYSLSDGVKIICYGLMLFIFFYLLGLGIIYQNLKKTRLSKKKHFMNYHLNLLASIIGAAYVSVILIYPYWVIRLMSTIILSIIAITVMYFIISNKKSNLIK